MPRLAPVTENDVRQWIHIALYCGVQDNVRRSPADIAAKRSRERISPPYFASVPQKQPVPPLGANPRPARRRTGAVIRAVPL